MYTVGWQLQYEVWCAYTLCDDVKTKKSTVKFLRFYSFYIFTKIYLYRSRL